MKGRRLTNRVLGFVLTLAMAFTLIPQVEAKANGGTAVAVPTTMKVLERLTGSTALAEGEYIYIVDDGVGNMTGQLPTAVSARVIYNTASNGAQNYITNYNGGNLNHVRYDTSNVSATGFDGCPRGALVSSDGYNWKYFCCYGGVQNLTVQPYVARTVTGTFTISMPDDTMLFDTPSETKTITKNDIAPLNYTIGNQTGTLDDFIIDNNDNTIGGNDNHITIKYGLNYSESQTVCFPVKYTVSFDTQGGTSDGTMANQVLGMNETITRPATTPQRDGYIFQGWTLTPGGNDYWDFTTGNTQVRTLYARWKHVQEVTASDIDMTYGNSQGAGASCLGDSTLSYTVTSGSNVVSVSNNGTITTKNVGDATIRIDASETETTLGGTKTIGVHVEKRDVKLYADNKQKVYGTDDPALTFSVDNTTPLANGDTVATAFAGALTREEGNNAGTYAINGDAITSANYNIVSFTPGTFTVSKRPVKVTADDKHTVYGLPDEELTFTATGLTGVEASGLVGDDELDIQLMRLPLNNAGEYTITPMEAEGANPNYDVAFVTGTYTIHTTDVVIKDIVARDKEYDGTDEAVVSAIVEGVNGERFVIENLKGTFETKNVVFTDEGDYAEQTVTLSGVICEDTGIFANYTYNGIPFASDAELPSTTAKIYPRKINVIAFDDEKYYGEDDPDLEWGLDDLSSIPGWEDLKDIVDVTLTRMPGEVLGSYSIIISGKSKDPNYDISFKSGRMKIARMESEALFEVETSREIKDDVDLAQSNDELLDMILTDKEKKMVEDGASVRVWFEVDPAQEITAQELFVITLGLPRGYNIGANYDINLFKKFSHLDKEQMHETPSGVGFSIKVPDELLKNVPAGMERTFTLIRIHDGVAQEIPCTYDPETGCIIFESSKFSIYTIAYKDSVVKNEKDAAVKTGDSAPVQKMLAMMVGAGFAIALLTYKRRKEDEMI